MLPNKKQPQKADEREKKNGKLKKRNYWKIKGN